MKWFDIEVWGEEVVHHHRRLRIEAPPDVTATEIEQLTADVFDEVDEPPSWEVEYSDGINGRTDLVVGIIEELHDNGPIQAKLVRDANGDLVLVRE